MTKAAYRLVGIATFSILAAACGSDESDSSSGGAAGAGASGGVSGGGTSGSGGASGGGGISGSGGASGSSGSSGAGGSGPPGAAVQLFIGKTLKAKLFAATENDQVIELSGSLSSGAVGVGRFFVSPDKTQVLFSSDEGPQPIVQLYVSSVNGGGGSIVSQVTTGAVGKDYAWSPDGTRIAYQAELVAGGGMGLYVVDKSGSNHVEISARAVEGKAVGTGFKWSPTGTHLLYRANENQDGDDELWVAGADGKNKVMLESDYPFSGSARDFRWTGDGTRALYAIGTPASGYDLMSAQTDGMGKVQLSPSAAEFREFLPAPSGNRVLFVARINPGPPQLYTTLADGTGNQKIGTTASNGGIVRIEFAPDGSRLAYRSRTGGSGSAYELRTIAPDGSGDVLVSGTLNVTPGGFGRGYTWSPDSNRLAFFDRASSTTRPIYTTRADGSGSPVKVSGDLSQNDVNNNFTDDDGLQQLVSPVFSPDGTCISYISEEETPGTPELYLVKSDGSGACAAPSADVVGHLPTQNGVGKVPQPPGRETREQRFSGLPALASSLFFVAEGGDLPANGRGLFVLDHFLAGVPRKLLEKESFVLR